MKASGWLGLSGDVKVSNESTFGCTTDIGEVGSSQSSWSSGMICNTGAKTSTKSSL
jgi:hypothetical protein